MYEGHFHLTRKPFASYPEPDMMVWAEGHKMARTMLVYGLTAASGIVVITGEIGSGKTTILTHLISQDRTGHILGRLNGNMGLGNDVPAWVLYGFGMESSGVPATQSLDRLTGFLAKTKAKRKKAVLFIDEAQLLDNATVENLRLLSDMQIGGKPVLQLVLLGQPELARKLNDPSLEQFRQRTISHYHLKALSQEETVRYVHDRLAKAGGRPDLISPEALGVIHQRTGGVPRRINILCDTAFVYAYGEGKSYVDVDTLTKVQDDRRQNGMLEFS